jgi:hypothetical protein
MEFLLREIVTRSQKVELFKNLTPQSPSPQVERGR